ncbi:TonB-dependent siderophore receptor [Novosphingobium sp. ES2-1]|uniref:TonB-dependent receptor plug domain-containing protein n=1 Tax=Novosphingobium sp. ES2-1 TaxID=2780074 RepID=UPI001882AC06|nr:TonB-dependent receptor [Novosphingobium sp. ES2-1]QOV94717.1 TonB-dependent receptor [Novosphingobium sp. ES2-1]
MRVLKTALLLSAATLPAVAHAEDAETIIVSANRTQQSTSEVAQSVTVITLDDIATRQSAGVADLLRSVPGITVTSNGGLGTTTSVNIRGAESDQTVALFDGVKLNDPSTPGGGFNFGNLLTGNIERIEVVRGSQSVLWGSQAIGGVVNIVTRAPTEKLALNLASEYGWRDTARVVGNISGKFGPVSANVGAGYLRTDGFSTFNETRGGTERDGYRNIGANAKFNIALSDAVSVDLRGWYSDGKVGIDGFPPPTYSFGDTPEFARTKELIGYAGLNAALFDGRFRNRIAYTLTDTRRRNVDLTGGIEFETFNAKGRNERFEYQGNFDITDAASATFGAETEKASFRTSSYGGPFAIASARINSFYGQLSAKPVAGLTLSAGLRHDDHDTFGGKTTFSTSALFTPNEGNTVLRASYGEGFKTPSLYQLFSDYGNKLLRPESSRSWDAGITQKLLDGRIEVGATWFHRDTRNLINFISCRLPLTGICSGRPNGTYDNVAKARAQGLEFTLALKPVDALRVQANYGYVDAINAMTGLDLARRPRHSVNVSADYDWAFGLKTGATITHVGASFDNAANTRKLDGYALVDLRAAFPVTHNIELYGRIENLFNEQYETSLRYGTPRRAAYAGVRLAF